MDKIILALEKICKDSENWGVSAQQVADAVHLHRSRVSRELNDLYRKGSVERKEGRPVLFRPSVLKSSLDQLIGNKGSLRRGIEKAKAALLYPPHGLHTLLTGETGVGKSQFARLMYEFGREAAGFKGAFIYFNCADYAHNPALLLSQLFGSMKGAYTGSVGDRAGLLEEADGGMLMLDEIHRLPPEGQEMLFGYLDSGFIRRLGETELKRTVQVFICAATTELPESILLKTFRRRIPMEIFLPSLSSRPMGERLSLIDLFFRMEQRRINKKIWYEPLVLQALLAYDCPGNIGQLKKDIQLSCAQAFAEQQAAGTINVLLFHLPSEARRGTLNIRHLSGRDVKDERMQAGVLIEQADIDPLRAESFPQPGHQPIQKIVGKEVLALVDEILGYAEAKLSIKYPQKVHVALAMHVNGMIQRLKLKYYEPNLHLNEMRKNHPDAFFTALECINVMEKRLDIEIPLDEAGYLTLFLISTKENRTMTKKVAIVIMAHGESTASSMLETAQHLLGVTHGSSLDIPLHQTPEQAYSRLRELTDSLETAKGILILADMGSLGNFGELLTNETGIQTETFLNVSTPHVIESLRKADLGYDLISIDRSLYEDSKIPFKGEEKLVTRYVIVLNCATGEGGAKQLEELLKREIELPLGMEYQAVAKEQMTSLIRDLNQKGKRVAAVVGLWRPDEAVLLYAAPSDLFYPPFKQRFGELLHKVGNRWTLFKNIQKSLREQFIDFDTDEVTSAFLNWLEENEARTGRFLEEPEFAGILMHFVCMFHRVIHHKEIKREDKEFEALSAWASQLMDYIPDLEENLGTAFPEYEKNVLLSLFTTENSVC